ncbi:MAG: MBG domain-containing protein, partial [Clostridium sp.]
MRKKKLWKKHCALGMAIVLASGNAVTPALADNTAVQVDNDTENDNKAENLDFETKDDETDHPDKGDSEGDNNTENNAKDDSNKADTDQSEKNDPENSGEDAGDPDKEGTDKDTTGSDQTDEKESEAEDEDKNSGSDDEAKDDEVKDTDEDENKDPEQSDTDKNEDTVKDPEQSDVVVTPEQPVPVEKVQKKKIEEIELLELPDIRLKGATVKVKSDSAFDLEDALADALLDEDEERPDQWFYYYERSDKSKNWIDINGETLKRLGKDVQYGSLEDYISKGTNPSIKICIGRKLSTSFGTSKTEVVGSSVSVKFINAATVTINGLTDHGSSNSIDSFVKYGTDFYFSITPDAGYVPTVKYSAQDENGNEIIEEETLEADISPDENNSSYHYTINGENITDDIQDIQIDVSYEKTLTRTVEITTNGGNVSVNDKAESDQASVEIAPESRSIKLKPQDGYAIESIKADETEITLKDSDFQNYAYTYIADKDEITEDAEPLQLTVTVKKVELVGKEGTPEVQWIKGTTELDDDFKNLLKNAIVDTENSYPDLDEMDNKYIKVEYLAREGLFGNNTYAELDYIPSGIAGAGAHKFGENTDANGNSTETIRISLTGNSRYKDASVEKKVVLKDIREDASFALQDETEIAYTDDLTAFKQAVYDQIVWKSAGAKPEISKFKIEVKGTLTYCPLEAAQLLGLLNVDETPELKITFAGNEAYREGEITASVKIVDPRPIGEFTIMTTPITYTSDVEKLKQELYDRITWTNGVKPSINQFTMQVKTGEIKTDGLPNVEFYVNLDKAPSTNLSVGTRTFKVKFAENEEFRGNEVVADLEIVKAKSSISVKNKKIIYGDQIPEDLVEVVPSDAGVLKIYAGVNSDLAAAICIQFPSYMVNIPVVGNVDLAEYLEKLLGESASIDDLLEKLNSTEGQAVLSILKAIGVDTDTFMKAFQTISDYLPESVTSFKVTFSAPQKAGGYTVIVAVVDPNYEAAVGIGSLIILPKTENIELRWTQDFSVLSYKDIPLNDDGSLDEEQAMKLFGAVLMDKETETVLDSSKVRYLFVGKDGDKEFYRSNKPSAKPGVYTETAYVLNGNNMDWPIVRTYVIGRTAALIQFKDGQMETAPKEDKEYGTSETLFATKHVTYNGEAQEFKAGLYLAATPETEIENADIQYRYYDVVTGTYLEGLPVNAGIYRVTADFKGNGQYTDAADQTGYLIIEKAQPKFVLEEQQNFTYNGEAQKIMVQSVEDQDPETKYSVLYKNDQTDENASLEAPVHAGTYRAILDLPETANYAAAHAEVIMNIIPAKATIEIHPVSFSFDEQTHGGSYLIYGIRDEIPEHEVSYSTDNEIFVADEPMAVGTYAMRIQITDPDYENDVETQEDSVVIKENE